VTLTLCVIAAGLGAMVRHRVNLLGGRWAGTLGVNVAGSFALGWLVVSRPSDDVVTIVGIGFLGTLTTFSMFALEATEGSPRHRVTVAGAMLTCGLAAAAAGYAIG